MSAIVGDSERQWLQWVAGRVAERVAEWVTRSQGVAESERIAERVAGSRVGDREAKG